MVQKLHKVVLEHISLLPLYMVENLNKGTWIFLPMILPFLFRYVLMCLRVESSCGSRVEPVALEKSLNLSEPLFLHH